MRYTAMIAGFLLATLTQVGAAEVGSSDYVEFTVHSLARSKTLYSAVLDWTLAGHGPVYASSTVTDRAGASRRTVWLHT